MGTMQIAGRPIGPGHPVYVIAELSANHGGDLERARELVRIAKDVGADAVKLQTYTADTLTIASDRECFRLDDTLWEGRTLHELYSEAFMPWEWQPELKALADRLGLDLFSSPFDASAVAFLEDMDVPAYKIASFENVDLPLLRTVAITGKPVIMSTGMATLAEVDEAVRTLREGGTGALALLRCVSAYPACPASMHLRTIPHLAKTFDVVAGLSDHTLDATVPVAAVTLGASIIEKHMTLSRDEEGPDSAFSLEPEEFRGMVEAVRTAEQALGNVRYGPTESEERSRVFRRSLFVVADMAAGERFTRDNVRSIRPGHGLHTRHLDDVLGRKAVKRIERGTPLSWELIG